MKRVYLIWFRSANETEDRVRGVALNWSQAERMADNLATHQDVVMKGDYDYGVKSYVINQIPFDFINDDGCFNTWGPDKFGDT